MASFRVRFPAFAAAAAAVSAVLIFTGNSPVEILCGFVLAISVPILYHKIPATLRVFAGIFYIVATVALLQAPIPFSAPEQRWRGIVESVRSAQASQRAIVSLDIPKGSRVSLTITDLTPELSPGDSLTFKASLCRAGRYLNVPGLRMADMADRAERISASAVVERPEVSVSGRSAGFYYEILALRDRLAEAVYASPLTPQAADLLVASTLGAGDAPADIRESFRAAGISHLLCVSGFHVGIVAMAVSFVLMPLRIAGRQRLRAFMLLVAVWAYATVVGLGASVVRAATMLTAYVLARTMQREVSAGNSLLVALAAVLILDPYSLWSAGLQLSFSAVAGILIFGVKLNTVPRRRKLAFKMLEIIVTPVAALLGTIPFTLLWFGKAAVLSVPVNAVACIVFPIYMLTGLASVVLWHVGFVAESMCTLTDVLADLILSFANRWAEFITPFSTDYHPGTLSLVCISLALIALAVALYSMHIKQRILSATFCSLLVLCTGCEPADNSRRMLITGDAFSSRILVAQPGYALDIVLEGVGNCSPRLMSFFSNTEVDSIATSVCKSGLIKVGSHRIFIADRKSVPTVDTPADILFIPGNFKGDVSTLLRDMPESRVILSACAPTVLCEEVDNFCRMSGRPFINLASEAIFHLF